jgi:hypothetical protein
MHSSYLLRTHPVHLSRGLSTQEPALVTTMVTAVGERVEVPHS